MGYEHRIRLAGPLPRDLDSNLRAVLGFDSYDATLGLYNFRRTHAAGMPDAHASVEDDGLYFCDNGAGTEILAELIALLEERYGPITVEEL